MIVQKTFFSLQGNVLISYVFTNANNTQRSVNDRNA